MTSRADGQARPRSGGGRPARQQAEVAVGETAILLTPPLIPIETPDKVRGGGGGAAE